MFAGEKELFEYRDVPHEVRKGVVSDVGRYPPANNERNLKEINKKSKSVGVILQVFDSFQLSKNRGLARQSWTQLI